LNGKTLKPRELQASLRVLCETLLRRGDSNLAFITQLNLPLGASQGKK
jgi:hypothetical protein